ncbi:MAG: AAA family ATPase [Defluviitaleaceae bacterium]|nr:AAA family ATPase [Defluviitaleaceae bacterium]
MTNLREEQISRITINGYKSIKSADIKLENINVLIGCNGAGKSNFVSVFELLQARLYGKTCEYGIKKGASTLFYNSPKVTEKILLQFYDNGGINTTYRFGLSEESELINLNPTTVVGNYWDSIDKYAKSQRQWKIYHCNDTSPMAKIKQDSDIANNEMLLQDFRNLSAFLYRLKNDYPKNYADIVQTIQLIAPFFADFVLIPQGEHQQYIVLRWQEKAFEDTFSASQLSDGTLRFICLATLLLQPPELQPATIIIDEPELGLHPVATTIFAELVKKAATNKQIILSTQSVELLNHFAVEDVIVVDRDENGSQFKRLNSAQLADWLEDDYTLGDLWKKNIIGGRFAQ